MTTIIDQMLNQYETKTIYDKKNALKEVLQEMWLLGTNSASKGLGRVQQYSAIAPLEFLLAPLIF